MPFAQFKVHICKYCFSFFVVVTVRVIMFLMNFYLQFRCLMLPRNLKMSSKSEITLSFWQAWNTEIMMQNRESFKIFCIKFVDKLYYLVQLVMLIIYIQYVYNYPKFILVVSAFWIILCFVHHLKNKCILTIVYNLHLLYRRTDRFKT